MADEINFAYSKNLRCWVVDDICLIAVLSVLLLSLTQTPALAGGPVCPKQQDTFRDVGCGQVNLYLLAVMKKPAPTVLTVKILKVLEGQGTVGTVVNLRYSPENCHGIPQVKPETINERSIWLARFQKAGSSLPIDLPWCAEAWNEVIDGKLDIVTPAGVSQGIPLLKLPELVEQTKARNKAVHHITIGGREYGLDKCGAINPLSAIK